MEREHGHLDGEREREGEEEEILGAAAGQDELREHGQVEGVGAGGGAVPEVERQDGHQHEQRARQGVEDELDRRVDAVAAAPDPDDEVHRDQHGLPEDVEEEEIERHEHAQHARLEQQHGDRKLLPASLDRVPGGEEDERHEEGGQQHQQQADPVHAQVVRDAEGGHPRALLDELIGGERRVEACEQRHRDREGHQARREGRHLDQALRPARQEKDHGGAQHGQEGHRRKD